jgi:hypothetical protein
MKTVKTVKPMKIVKDADKYLNDGQNMYLPKDHPSYSAIEALLYTKNVALSGDLKVFDVIVESKGENVWIWLETGEDHRDQSYSFTKNEVKDLLSRPTTYMQILRNASARLAEVDSLEFGSSADWIVRGIMAEFGAPLGAEVNIVEILIDHELVHVFMSSKEVGGACVIKKNFQFKVEFVSDYERLVDLRGDLRALQSKFALS